MAVVRAHKFSSSTCYDVFLNFREEDTRKTFTHHLHTALVQQGYSTFRYEDKMYKDENQKSELEKAIRQSKSSIVVISKDYASSTWSLDELVLILEQRRTSGHIVLPVFYDVDPSHVRKQSGRIAEAFARYKEQFETESNSERKRKLMEKLKGWRSALTEVGYLIGLDLRNPLDGHESQFIKNIVKIIEDKLIQTVAFKIRLLSGCIHKIERIISKINGVKKVTLYPRIDLVTITGRVDVKELVLYFEEKLMQSVKIVKIIPVVNKDNKGSDKKDKDSGGDKKEKESGGGGGGGGVKKEMYKIKYRYNPNTNTMSLYHQNDKKQKESNGRSGKKENKTEYHAYYLNTYTMPMYYSCTVEYSQYSPSPRDPSYYYHGMFSDDNPNACSIM